MHDVRRHDNVEFGLGPSLFVGPERLAELGVYAADCIVSSLPLTVMPRDVTHSILQAASHLLRPGGSLLIYVPACPIAFGSLDAALGHFRRYPPDTLAALRESKRMGHTTLAICNVVGSTIAREACGGVYLHAGPEVGVASTKAFTSQVAVLTMLALYFGRTRHLSAGQGQRIIDDLRALPDAVRKALGCHGRVREAEVPVASILARHEKTARDEAPQVLARSRGRDPGARGQLTRRQRLILGQRDDERRPRGLGEQRSRGGDVRLSPHVNTSG